MGRYFQIQKRCNITHYRERKSGELIPEKIPGHGILVWLYENLIGRLLLRILVGQSWPSTLFGIWQRRRFTKRNISKFVKDYDIDVDEIELPLNSYPNFNSFFSRRLKPEARPFEIDPKYLLSPSDGKIIVYPTLSPKKLLPIKGSLASIEELFKTNTAEQSYYDGAAAVIRLAPYDYHRFHFFDNGEAKQTKNINGTYHSVNPVALKNAPTLFTINKRAITEVDTQSFGQVAYIEIGALNVGSIIQTYTVGSIKRGQEKGYFQFGGSTIVLVFSHDSVQFDDDLLTDSAEGIETHISAGQIIGRSI